VGDRKNSTVALSAMTIVSRHGDIIPYFHSIRMRSWCYHLGSKGQTISTVPVLALYALILEYCEKLVFGTTGRRLGRGALEAKVIVLTDVYDMVYE